MNKWISVADRKPHDGQRVIAWEDFRSIGRKHQGAELFYYRTKYGFVAAKDDEDGYGCITHWMPAPFDKGPNDES